MQADDGHARDVSVRYPAEVLGEAQRRAGQLPLAGTPQKLGVDLIDHAQTGGTDRMAEALQATVGLARHRAIAVVVSDFIGSPAVSAGRRRGKLRPQMMLLESLAQASFAMLRQANRRHDVVAVQIADRYELELPALGRLVLHDAETGEVVEINTGDERKRAAFAERQARTQTDLARLFRSAGIDAIRLRTDQPYGVELGKFFETRERRRMRG